MATLTETISVQKMKGFTIPRELRTSILMFLLYAVLLSLSVFFLFPLVFMVGTSLKTITEVNQTQLSLLPAIPQWVNYTKLFNDPAFFQAYGNTLFVIPLILLGTVTSI